MSEDQKEIKLTGKQKLFADFYIGEANLNATKAARLAGYKGKDSSLSQIGYENLRKLEISVYINERLKGSIISANETLAIISAHCKGRITDVMNEKNELDIDLAIKRGTDGLIKKMKIKRTVRQVKREPDNLMRGFLAPDELEEVEKETSILYEQIEFEIHDPQPALDKAARYHKLLTDKVEHGGSVELSHKEAVDLSKLSNEELVVWEKLLEKTNAV